MTETKKEAFRKYLETAGAIDALTRVLVSLYEEPERPKDATEFMKGLLGAPTTEQFNKLEAENAKLKGDLDRAKAEIDELRSRVAELQSGTVEPA
jgi:predicted nuclease with TOPRIM domain